MHCDMVGCRVSAVNALPRFFYHCACFAVLNGPISPNSGKGNEPNLMKWFGTDVLKTSLPHMPPIPTQGQRVMTVDEIERHTQAVSN